MLRKVEEISYYILQKVNDRGMSGQGKGPCSVKEENFKPLSGMEK